MSETWHDRVRSVAQKQNISIAKVARKAGLGEGKLRNALNVGTKKMNDDPLLKKTAAALDVDPYWLLTGQAVGGYSPPVSITHGVAIPIYNVDASAGGGNFVGKEEQNGELFLSLDLLPPNHSALVCVTVSADSMEPTLVNGQKIIVDLSNTALSASGIYLINDGLITMVKRLNYKLRSRILEIVSDNPEYDRVEIALDEFNQNSINVIGRVVLGIKKM